MRRVRQKIIGVTVRAIKESRAERIDVDVETGEARAVAYGPMRAPFQVLNDLPIGLDYSLRLRRRTVLRLAARGPKRVGALIAPTPLYMHRARYPTLFPVLDTGLGPMPDAQNPSALRNNAWFLQFHTKYGQAAVPEIDSTGQHIAKWEERYSEYSIAQVTLQARV